MNIEDIQNICKALPSATEDIKWGNALVFSIGGKMFFIAGLNQSPPTASFKVTNEDFDAMCDREGFKPAPYLARYKWIYVDDITRMNKDVLNKYIKQSYHLVSIKLSSKIKKELGLF